MTDATMTSVLRPIAPVGLAELEASATLMTRRDRKYPVPWEVAGELVSRLSARTVWELGYRPIKVSKFCTSLSALYPELPHDKWTQALRRPWTVLDRQPLAVTRSHSRVRGRRPRMGRTEP